MDHKLFNKISTLVFDVDGVFTNSQVVVLDDGSLIRTMSTRDGQAVKIALDAGYNIAIITKGASEGVKKRFLVLGIVHIFDKVNDKVEVLDLLKELLDIRKEEILYLGDDIPDLPVYNQVGISVCPADGAHENLERAMYITAKNGGEGCVREIIEKVMRQQGKWNF